eukprot:4675901-Amphidinium_carterae.1
MATHPKSSVGDILFTKGFGQPLCGMSLWVGASMDTRALVCKKGLSYEGVCQTVCLYKKGLYVKKVLLVRTLGRVVSLQG